MDQPEDDDDDSDDEEEAKEEDGEGESDDDDDDIVRPRSAKSAKRRKMRSVVSISPVRIAQHTLLRRSIFALYVSHALYQSVQLREGEVRMELALGLLERVVWPIMLTLNAEE